MKSNIDTYRIWAPDTAEWTAWAKPVLFAVPPGHAQALALEEAAEQSWAPVSPQGTAIIVDLPGETGVAKGISLARQGWRPVPLYNGTMVTGRSTELVRTRELVEALYKGAEMLETIRIREDAPPVFLLDSNRMNGTGRYPGKYDNRWCVFPQDMPSAQKLKDRGIRTVILRSDRLRNDLAHILHRYHQAGIGVQLCAGDRPQELRLVKPSGYLGLSYRFKTTTGLIRNAAGGFGGRVPEPTQSSSGVRIYGHG